MGSLRDEITAVPYRKWDWVLERLGSEADEFVELLGDATISPARLHEILLRRDIVIPEKTVYQWARSRRKT